MGMSTGACWGGHFCIEPGIYVSNWAFCVEPFILLSNRAFLCRTSVINDDNSHLSIYAYLSIYSWPCLVDLEYIKCWVKSIRILI